MEDKGEESTKEDAVGEPPGEEEGDIYARSSGLIKVIFLRCVRLGVCWYNAWRYCVLYYVRSKCSEG